MRFFLFCFFSFLSGVLSYDLNIIHYNDFHGRFGEFNINSTTCDPNASPCIGGFPRLYTLIKELWQKHPQSLILNAGDSFQGTMWYNIFKWNLTERFMNYIPHDAHAIGNHEFISGIDGLTPYLQSLQAPVLAANLDSSLVPSMSNLYKKSVIVEKLGRRIGIIGVTTASSQTNFRVGKLIFLNEADAVLKEAKKLSNMKVDIIIVVSHCGLEADRKIANAAGEFVDVIVGGHSHFLLYSGKPPSGEVPVDEYPVVVNHTSGNTVLIVQASAYTKYLGNLLVSFNDTGNIISWIGQPIFLNSSVLQNDMILKLLEPFQAEVDRVSNQIVGYSKMRLDSKACFSDECNFGNVVCEAFLNEVSSMVGKEPWMNTALCLVNSRSLRIDIPAGAITYGDLSVAMPFNNTVDVFRIEGQYIKKALEHSVGVSWSKDTFIGPNFLQVSGMKIVFNISHPVGDRIVSVDVRCQNCNTTEFVPLKLDNMYTVVSTEFITNGGDGYFNGSINLSNLRRVNADLDSLENYIKLNSPLNQDVDGRIVMRS